MKLASNLVDFQFCFISSLVFCHFGFDWSRGTGQRKNGVRMGMKQISS